MSFKAMEKTLNVKIIKQLTGNTIDQEKWWNENKEMFEDSFEETVKYMKNENFEYKKEKTPKIKPMKTIPEETTYASILKK